jgi:hypothetical protein
MLSRLTWIATPLIVGYEWLTSTGAYDPKPLQRPSNLGDSKLQDDPSPTTDSLDRVKNQLTQFRDQISGFEAKLAEDKVDLIQLKSQLESLDGGLVKGALMAERKDEKTVADVVSSMRENLTPAIEALSEQARLAKTVDDYIRLSDAASKLAAEKLEPEIVKLKTIVNAAPGPLNLLLKAVEFAIVNIFHLPDIIPANIKESIDDKVWEKLQKDLNEAYGIINTVLGNLKSVESKISKFHQEKAAKLKEEEDKKAAAKEAERKAEEAAREAKRAQDDLEKAKLLAAEQTKMSAALVGQRLRAASPVLSAAPKVDIDNGFSLEGGYDAEAASARPAVASVRQGAGYDPDSVASVSLEDHAIPLAHLELLQQGGLEVFGNDDAVATHTSPRVR